MTLASFHLLLPSLAWVLLLAQAVPPSSTRTLATTPLRGTDELATGWAALAAGRAGDAESIADRMLQAATRRHDALLLKIHARLQADRMEAALEAYEQALGGAAVEDVYLLQPIARKLLDGLSSGADVDARIRALQALAQAGDREAAARLGELSASDQTGAADVALAELRNPQAIARLEQRVASPGLRDVSDAIDALLKANAQSAAAAIASALDPSRPVPTRLSAARALGQLGARDRIPHLQRALRDPDTPVRMMAAVALSRLGDQSGAELLRQMEQSPVADIRLMVAEITAPQNPDGPWMAMAVRALEDPDPLVRLSAAELLVKFASDPRPGLRVLSAALSDANPAMRLAASRALEEIRPALLSTELAELRRWLRDPIPQVRVAAAAALLGLAGGIE